MKKITLLLNSEIVNTENNQPYRNVIWTIVPQYISTLVLILLCSLKSV